MSYRDTCTICGYPTRWMRPDEKTELAELAQRESVVGWPGGLVEFIGRLIRSRPDEWSVRDENTIVGPRNLTVKTDGSGHGAYDISLGDIGPLNVASDTLHEYFWYLLERHRKREDAKTASEIMSVFGVHDVG